MEGRVAKVESVQESILNRLDSIDDRLAGIDGRLVALEVRFAAMISSIAMLQILTVGVILAIIAVAVATILTR